jgi:hypothetical protein
MRITIKTKLGLAFATVIALSGITAWLGVSNLSSLNETMEALLAGPVERIQMALGLSTDLLLAIRAEKNLLLAGSNTEEKARSDAELLKQREVFGTRLDKLDAVASVEGKSKARSGSPRCVPHDSNGSRPMTRSAALCGTTRWLTRSRCRSVLAGSSSPSRRGRSVGTSICSNNS